ncbi:MAG: chromosomal replication initiator protein DnaA [Elusimicrobia bacterium RIFOXYA2_FULL_39_19]|nr:MAG: chromosomal replication initiator protein DnaA [Elusimicrobia bacterium RIFOXYA2_FULL_39_19]
MLEKFELAHSPSDKDKNRYRLKIRIVEEELNDLLQALKVDSGRPFASFSDEYNFGIYIYDLNDQKLDDLRNILTDKSTQPQKAVIPDVPLPAAPNPIPEPPAQVPQPETTTPARQKAVSGNDDFFKLSMNAKYTFEEFVVGSSNRFTHAAGMAVAENPGKVYNPLFIYGGVGLGKTHLMQAIGHFACKKYPDLKVFYVTSEKFISEVIDSIGRGTLAQFRDRYRQMDLLLVDDIQFLAESESTQEEFFHTFNILHQSGKQIVLTSDRPPKQLTTLEDRLKSRFEWGLIADIKSPSLETRVAILKRKGETEQVNLDDNMLLYVASKLKSNIRELEGFLKRINAYASITNQTVDMEMVKSLMKDLLPNDPEDEAPSPEVQQITPQPPAQVYSVPVQPIVKPQPAPTLAPVKPPQAAQVPITAVQKPVEIDGVDKNLRAIDIVFFFPEGKEQELIKAKEKFRDVIKKHNLKFRLESVFDRSYIGNSKMNYNMFSELCKTNKVSITVVIGPPPEANVHSEDFMSNITAIMENAKISLQYLSWDELNKDYRYLNLALDITLTKHKDLIM